ncbi:MAG: hypothetical protein GX264_00300 [Clostridiales bacterium]|jgi:hypothetical protein|nr:hypothetical protein [Clostridiales bacterium]
MITRGSDDQLNELIATLKSYDKDKLSAFVDRNLDSQKKKKLEEILSDEKKMKQMLNTDMGRELLKKFEEG